MLGEVCVFSAQTLDKPCDLLHLLEISARIQNFR